ncbi:MAG TPA: response regulator [Steroidobacteraceae bacterium]|nr:response regulator [Steroidobacteraceae bacterium]
MSGTLRQPIVVLHVEDDEELGAGVARFLRAHGCNAETARDGPSALARLAQLPAAPDVLIMDFMLPGDMDGADVAQEICRMLGHVVPTVFLSGELSNASLPWLPGAPLLFVAKPVDAETLLAVIESFAVLGRLLLSHARH